jgi:hypothetical protein
MKRNSEAAFWLVAFATAVLYGFMHAGQYGVSFFGGKTQPRTIGLLVHAVMETYGWLPSFAAGLIVARRAVLLGLLVVLLGKVFTLFFRDLLAPTLIIDDWDPAVVNLVQLALAIVEAVVAATAGQFLANRGSSNKPFQPIARENARSG